MRSQAHAPAKTVIPPNEQLKILQNRLFIVAMKSLLITITCLSLFLRICIADEDDNTTEKEITCRERNRKIISEKGDLYKLVEATVGETLMLQCHYW